MPTDPAPLSDTVKLCRELVQRPSVTPADHGCQALIGDRLASIGFELEHLPAEGVDNLWARFGCDAPLMVLAGHTDVVPTGAEADWSSPPFDAAIIDGHLVGRGAADMKGSVAAMVTAAERFVSAHGSHMRGSLAILLTSDEEGPAEHGTAHVIRILQARGEQIDLCLVGEPTSAKQLGDTIKNGRRGSLGCAMTVRGIQGHVAYPQLADNPVHRVAPFLTQLVAVEWDQGNEHFPPTTLQISNMHAGTGASNVIPGQCQIDFNVRYSPETQPEHVMETVNALVKAHGLDADCQWRQSASPFITGTGTLTQSLQAAIHQIVGIDARLETGGGTSDGRFIAPTGAQVVEFGPLNHTIHQIDEQISCEDLDLESRIVENLLERLLLDT